MDTTTRKSTTSRCPGTRGLGRPLRTSASPGDSRSLLTSYETPEAPRTRGHRFVAWDVQDGTPTVLEEPGHYWLPEPGSGATGVVWTRGHTVYREDPATGGRSSYALPWPAVTSSWAPDDTAFAYLGCPPGRTRSLWWLYAGRSLAEARDRALPLPVEPGKLLGWRDDRHVVVGHYRTTVHVVDVVTGDTVELVTAGDGTSFNAPLLAADPWRNPLAAPVEPDGTTDPRRPLWSGGGALLTALACALVVSRTRARLVRTRAA